MTINKFIGPLMGDLHLCVIDCLPGQTVATINARLLAEMEGGRSLNHILEDALLNSMGTDPLATAEYAIASCHLAQQAFEDGGLEAAVPGMLRAAKRVGALEWWLLTGKMGSDVRANAKRGGEAGGKAADEAKERACELLRDEELRPVGGWGSITEASEKVGERLKIDPRFRGQSTNFVAAVRRWISGMRSVPTVKAAYEWTPTAPAVPVVAPKA